MVWWLACQAQIAGIRSKKRLSANCNSYRLLSYIRVVVWLSFSR